VHFVRIGFRELCVVVATALLQCGAALAQDSRALALDEAVRIAEERSQQLRADDAAAAAAREMAAVAAEAPDPILTAGVNNLPINGPDQFSVSRDFMTMRSLALSRELTRHDKRDARATRYEREAEVAEADRAVALADLQRETAMAWLERYYRERMHEILMSQRDQAALQIEAADLSYRSGLGAQGDVFAARAAVGLIEDRLAATARDRDVATIRLARWIGSDADRRLGAAPAMAAVPLTAADLEGELAHHPEVALMLKQEEMARADAEIARTEKRSDWTIEVMYSQRGSAFSDMMSLNVSKPLQWREGRRQGRELAARLATTDRMRAEREEETRAHVADTRALLQAWQANRQRLERYSGSLIPLVADRTTAATTAYRSGTGSLSAVLDARVGEIDARLDYLELEMETANLWAQLNFLVPAGHGPASTSSRNP
jgi:outer membrane protein TolC